MWADYFPDALIVGIDRGQLPTVRQENVRLYAGRQEDRKLLERITTAYGPWDVVIDDGSHRAVDQLASFEALWPRLRKGGFYAVEDLHAPEACTPDQLKKMAGLELEYMRVVARRLAVLRKR